jgi:hypothetical protein
LPLYLLSVPRSLRPCGARCRVTLWVATPHSAAKIDNLPLIYAMARERGAQVVARLLAETAQSDELGTLPAFAPERLTTRTRFFQDVVLFPVLFRALFGEKLERLRAEIEPYARRSVALFLGACRHGVS